MRGRIAAVFALHLWLLVVACGAAPRGIVPSVDGSGVDARVVDPAAPFVDDAPVRAHVETLPPDGWSAPAAFAPEAPLAVRFDEVRATLREAGYDPFDAVLVWGTAPTRDFVRVTTFQAEDAVGAVHHVVFVVDGPWTTERTDRFLQTFFALPSATPESSGRPRFHFAPSAGVPFELTWVFGNRWWGELESSALMHIGGIRMDTELGRVIEGAAAWWVERIGAAVPSAADDREVARVVGALPRGPEGGTWIPVGTLVGLGVRLGESLRATTPGLAWAHLPEVSRFPVLVRASDDAVVRPVDVVIDAWRFGRSEVLPVWVPRMRQRLAENVPPQQE